MSGGLSQVVLFVALGAAGGGIARFGLVTAATVLAPNFPYGTLVANLLGCFAMGMLIPTLSEMPVHIRALVVTGFLGGLTTMSGFALEATGLYRNGEYVSAVLYWAASAIGCIAICAFGMLLSSVFFARSAS